MLRITGLCQAIMSGLFLTVLAGAAMAQTVTIGNPIVSGPLVTTTTNVEYGQEFVVPAGVTRITRAGLVVYSVVTTNIAIKDGIGGATLGQSTAFTGNEQPPYHGVLREMVIPSGGITVTPGQTYYLTSSNGSVALADDYYAEGSITPLHTTKDAYFIIEFGNAPPAAVPTLSEWSLIFLGLTMVGGSMVLLTRRRRQA